MVDREILKRLFLSDLNMSDVALDKAEAFEIARREPTEANIRTYAILAQAEAFSKKASDGEISDELIAKSDENNRALEARMRKVNLEKGFLKASWFLQARDLVHKVLTPIQWIQDDMWSLCRFGPGVTCSTSGARGRYLLEKIGGEQTSTRRALPIFLDVVREYYPNWVESLSNTSVTVVGGNRTSYVPKDVRKCRRIAIEPSCNLFLQMGVGNWIARRLRYFGVDIYDQSINKDLARKGSLDGSVATIDLSDASDSISRELVRSLVPRDWFCLLDSIRSPAPLDGPYYERFSSQGNAFTFPLETLIFWAIVKSVSSFCSVYGDDIICDTESYHKALQAIADAGFIPNSDKSYGDGFFRESCGGDYIAGVDVRPIFYKETCRRPSDVAKLHNLLISKWGWNLPLTRRYLTSLVKVPLYGPQYFWSTDKDRPWKNLLVQRLDAYFFSKDSRDWSRDRWGVRPKKVKWWKHHSWSTRKLAFLYAQRNIEEESALTEHIVVRNTDRFVPG